MSGNPGSGRGAFLLGVRVTRGCGQAPPLSESIRLLHILICSGSNRWAPTQLAPCHQFMSETLFYPSPQISRNSKPEKGKSFRMKPEFCPRLAAVTRVADHMQSTADAPVLNSAPRTQLGCSCKTQQFSVSLIKHLFLPSHDILQKIACLHSSLHWSAVVSRETVKYGLLIG